MLIYISKSKFEIMLSTYGCRFDNLVTSNWVTELSKVVKVLSIESKWLDSGKPH
jgi:hypothetical protein